MAIIKKSTFVANEKNIVKLLLCDRKMCDRYPIMMPNCYYQSDNEADIFCIRNSGFTDEFEIKTSRADFKKDEKKRVKYREPENCSNVFRGGEYEQWASSGRVIGEEPWIKLKRDALAAGELVPNYFWYVLMEGITYKEEEIPKWAGIIIVSEHGFSKTLRNPKRLHSSKVSANLRDKVLLKGVYRYLDILRGWRDK